MNSNYIFLINLIFYLFILRHRKHDDEGMSGCARCCFSLFVIAAQILLNGAMGLCLYWVIQYHTPEVFLFIDLNLEWEMTCFVTTAGQDAVRVEGRHEAAVQPPPGPNDRRLHLLHGPM